MSRRLVTVPVKDSKKDFCDFMAYEFKAEMDGLFYYRIPASHVCRLLINHERWLKGEFDKEKFIKSHDY